jgi:uncharacterized cupredoxin-like copper-binding protein
MEPKNRAIVADSRKFALDVRRVRRLAMIALAVLFAGSALAQVQGGARIYDPSTETTVQGTIDTVTNTTGRHGWSGMHLRLKSGDKVYEVHVGPSAYIEKSGFTFSAGEQIEVVGSKVQLQGVDTLIAREITKDGKHLTLRDKQGIPAWSGGGWRSQ